MKKSTARLLSMILTLVMVVTSVDLNVFAASLDPAAAVEETIVTTPETITEDTVEEAIPETEEVTESEAVSEEETPEEEDVSYSFTYDQYYYYTDQEGNLLNPVHYVEEENGAITNYVVTPYLLDSTKKTITLTPHYTGGDDGHDWDLTVFAYADGTYQNGTTTATGYTVADDGTVTIDVAAVQNWVKNADYSSTIGIQYIQINGSEEVEDEYGYSATNEFQNVFTIMPELGDGWFYTYSNGTGNTTTFNVFKNSTLELEGYMGNENYCCINLGKPFATWYFGSGSSNNTLEISNLSVTSADPTVATIANLQLNKNGDEESDYYTTSPTFNIVPQKKGTTTITISATYGETQISHSFKVNVGESVLPDDISDFYNYYAYDSAGGGYPVMAGTVTYVSSSALSGFWPQNSSPTFSVTSGELLVDGVKVTTSDLSGMKAILNGTSYDSSTESYGLTMNVLFGYLSNISAGSHKLSGSMVVKNDYNGKSYTLTFDEATATFGPSSNAGTDVEYSSPKAYVEPAKGSTVSTVTKSLPLAQESTDGKITKIELIGHTDGVIYANATGVDTSSKVTNLTDTSTYGYMLDNGIYMNTGSLLDAHTVRYYSYSSLKTTKAITTSQYLDVVYTTSKGLKYTDSKAYYCTVGSDSSVMYMGFASILNGWHTDYISGDYVVGYVYGRNVTEADIPNFYANGDSTTPIASYDPEDEGCVLRDTGYECYYTLRKNEDADYDWDVTEGEIYAGYADGSSVVNLANGRSASQFYSQSSGNVYAEECVDGKFRFFFTEGKAGAGDSVQVTMDLYSSGDWTSQGSYTTSLSMKKNENGFYVEVPADFLKNYKSSQYANFRFSWSHSSTSYSASVSTWGGVTNSNIGYSTVSNIDVPGNWTYRLYRFTDMSQQISSGSGRGSETLSTAVVRRLAATGDLYVVDYQDADGEDMGFEFVKFTAGKVTITFNANGGKGTMAKQVVGDDTSGTLNALTFTRDGFMPMGWSTTADGDVEFNNQASLADVVANCGSNVTLYAVWDPISYKVAFHTNAPAGKTVRDGVLRIGDYASGLEESAIEDGYVMQLGYDEVLTLGTDEFALDGYTLTGWNTLANGKGTTYKTGDLSKLTTTNDATVNLYAMWSKNSYKITYNLNKGSLAAGHKTSVTYDVDTPAFEIEIPTRTGYAFAGWYTDKNLTDQYSLCDDVFLEFGADAILEDLTLYAAWDPVEYTVCLDGNVDAVANDVEQNEDMDNEFYGVYDQTVTYNSTGLYTCDGYKLTGWNTKADGTGTSYGLNLKLKNPKMNDGSLPEDGDTLTLYAVWKANSYTITYSYNGKAASKAPKKYTTSKEDLTITADGWKPATGYVNGDLSNLTIPAGTYGNFPITVPTQEITYDLVIKDADGTEVGRLSDTLYSQSLTVSHSMSNGSYTVDLSSYATETTDVIGLKIGSKTYKMGSTISKLATVDGAEVEATLVYGAPTYAITYDLDGGTIKSAPTSYTKGKQTTVPNPTRAGYNFNGWVVSGDSSIGSTYSVDANKKLTILVNSTGDRQLTATWTPWTYTLSTNANGGTETDPIESEYEYNEIVTKSIAEVGDTKAGYTLISYNTAKNGKGKTIPLGTDGTFAISGSALGVTKDNQAVTLYAQWKANEYTITSTEDGISAGYDSYTYGKAVTLKNPTKTGYTFLGWTVDSGTDVSAVLTYKKGTSYVTAIPKTCYGNVVLTPNWTANNATVTIDFNGAKNDAKKTYSGKISENYDSFTPIYLGDYINGSALKAEVNGEQVSYCKAGYVFMGWSTKKSGAAMFAPEDEIYLTDISSAFAKNNGSITLYAVWQKPVTTGVKLFVAGETGEYSSFEVEDSIDWDLYEIAISGDRNFSESYGGIEIMEGYQLGSDTAYAILHSPDTPYVSVYVRIRRVMTTSDGQEYYGAWSNVVRTTLSYVDEGDI